MRLWIAACVCAVAVSVSAPVAAQSAEELAEARRIFAEGIDLGAQGHWDTAAERFRRVMEIHPAPAVSYNLAVALEHLEHYLEADDVLGPVLEDPTAPATVRQNAEELATRVRARLARVTIQVTGAAPDAEVMLDGVLVPSNLLVRYRTDPGSRTVTLVVHGDTVATQTVVLAPGGDETVTLSAAVAEPVVPLPTDVQPAPAPTPASPLTAGDAPPAHGGGGGVLTKWWFWTAVGVVAVGAVTAVVVVAQPGDPTPVTGNLGLFSVRPL